MNPGLLLISIGATLLITLAVWANIFDTSERRSDARLIWGTAALLGVPGLLAVISGLVQVAL